MNQLNIVLMGDGSLFDIESFGESVFELLPTIYKIDVGNKTYQLGEEDNDFLKQYSNATDVTIHLLMFQNDIKKETVKF